MYPDSPAQDFTIGPRFLYLSFSLYWVCMSLYSANVSPLAVDVMCSDDALRVALADGRAVSVPLNWFPRLENATPKERRNWRLIGGGLGIRWEAIDEDVSVENLLRLR